MIGNTRDQKYVPFNAEWPPNFKNDTKFKTNTGDQKGDTVIKSFVLRTSLIKLTFLIEFVSQLRKTNNRSATKLYL